MDMLFYSISLLFTILVSGLGVCRADVGSDLRMAAADEIKCAAHRGLQFGDKNTKLPSMHMGRKKEDRGRRGCMRRKTRRRRPSGVYAGVEYVAL